MSISWRRLVILVVITTIILSIALLLIVDYALQPILYQISEAKVSNLVTKRINQTIQQRLDEVTYDNLVQLKTDQQGNIVYMQPNIQQINQISSQLSINIQHNLEELSQKEIELPLIQILGIELLADYGPTLTAKIIPYSSIETAIEDDFQAAGINQTRHRINLAVKAKTRVIIPFLSEKVITKLTIPLSEAVIVGDVPEVYVDLKNGLLGSDSSQLDK
ncbi:MAG: sporulation protein YunB [Bacillota bacterium]